MALTFDITLSIGYCGLKRLLVVEDIRGGIQEGFVVSGGKLGRRGFKASEGLREFVGDQKTVNLMEGFSRRRNG